MLFGKLFLEKARSGRQNQCSKLELTTVKMYITLTAET